MKRAGTILLLWVVAGALVYLYWWMFNEFVRIHALININPRYYQ